MNMVPSQKPGVHFVSGIPVMVPNSTYNGDGFYISHNERDRHIYGAVTTALVTMRDGMTVFYILKGDHREGYAAVMGKGLSACVEYFLANIDKISKYSDKPPSVEAAC